MKKIIAPLFVLYCCISQTTWASPTEVKTLLPTTKPVYQSNTHTYYKNQLSPYSSIVKAGGLGGNARIGKLIYSGKPDNLPALNVSRTPANGRCQLANENVIVFNYKTKKLIEFDCVSPDPEHDNLYWNGNLGEANDGYSPENDTLYAVDVITNLFKEWYDIPIATDENGLKSPIKINLHIDYDNASIGDNDIDLGDGRNIFYPLTSLSVISHMAGMLFTKQHSQLYFSGEQGGIYIAFSCMTAMAAEFYTTNKNTWEVGSDISKNGEALHYMDKPSKNCHGTKPGDGCDIDTVAQYHSRMEPHYSSGVFNRAFYLLATTSGWDTHKAYDVFVQANRYHWNNKNTNFQSGACDAVTSAKELGYDAKSVMIAFSHVGIDTRDC